MATIGGLRGLAQAQSAASEADAASRFFESYAEAMSSCCALRRDVSAAVPAPGAPLAPEDGRVILGAVRDARAKISAAVSAGVAAIPSAGPRAELVARCIGDLQAEAETLDWFYAGVEDAVWRAMDPRSGLANVVPGAAGAPEEPVQEEPAAEPIVTAPDETESEGPEPVEAVEVAEEPEQEPGEEASTELAEELYEAAPEPVQEEPAAEDSVEPEAEIGPEESEPAEVAEEPGQEPGEEVCEAVRCTLTQGWRARQAFQRFDFLLPWLRAFSAFFNAFADFFARRPASDFAFFESLRTLFAARLISLLSGRPMESRSLRASEAERPAASARAYALLA